MDKRAPALTLGAVAALVTAFVLIPASAPSEVAEAPSCVRPADATATVPQAMDYSECLVGITPTPSETPSPSETPTDPPPPPDAHALIGMSAPDNVWDQRKAQVEATGGHLQARRLFYNSLTASTARIGETLDAGLYPVASWKVGQSWATVANGGQDAALRSLAGKLAAFDEPLSVAFHHEPDQQSNPPDVGEGGTAVDFARMQAHIIDVMAPLAPKVEFSVIVNGWWWSGRASHLTDAQIAVWLPPSLLAELDVVAADDYSPNGGEEALVKTRNRVAWAKRVGGVNALGVGETNAFTATALRNEFAYVKAWDLFDGGWVLVWNSDGSTYKPLDQTGLLDDFQDILLHWPDQP